MPCYVPSLCAAPRGERGSEVPLFLTRHTATGSYFLSLLSRKCFTDPTKRPGLRGGWWLGAERTRTRCMSLRTQRSTTSAGGINPSRYGCWRCPWRPASSSLQLRAIWLEIDRERKGLGGPPYTVDVYIHVTCHVYASRQMGTTHVGAGGGSDGCGGEEAAWVTEAATE